MKAIKTVLVGGTVIFTPIIIGVLLYHFLGKDGFGIVVGLMALTFVSYIIGGLVLENYDDN